MALACLVSIVLLFQLTQLALMALTSFTEAFLFTLFLFAPFSLELVAFGYQPLGLSPVTGELRMASHALKRIVSKCHQLLLTSTEQEMSRGKRKCVVMAPFTPE